MLARMNEVLNRRSYIRNLVASVAKELGRLRRTMGRVVGIDLGTTFSLIAYMDAQTTGSRSAFRGRTARRCARRW